LVDLQWLQVLKLNILTGSWAMTSFLSLYREGWHMKNRMHRYMIVLCSTAGHPILRFPLVQLLSECKWQAS